MLEIINEAGTIALTSAAEKLKSDEVIKVARDLARDGLIEIQQHSGTHTVRAKFERHVRLSSAALTGDSNEAEKLTAPQQRVIGTLKNEESLSFPELLTRAQVGPSPVMTLAKRELVEIFQQRLRRDPLSNSPAAEVTDYVLTEDQEKVIAEISRSLGDHAYSPFLLHGVTGSGKTEIYIRAMRMALKLGRSALMLVPRSH